MEISASLPFKAMGLLSRFNETPKNPLSPAPKKNDGTPVNWIYAPFCTRTRAEKGYSMHWIEAYNTVENVWQRLDDGIPGLRHDEILKGFAMVAIGTYLYIVGGRVCRKNDRSSDNFGEGGSFSPAAWETDVRVREEVYKLDCVTHKWTPCEGLHIARVDFAYSVFNGKIYVAGGRSQTSQAKGVSSAEVYDPVEDAWTVLPNMSRGRYKSVGVTWEGKIYVVGGFAGPEDSETTILPFSTDRSSVEVFDPAAGKWDLIHGMWQLDVPPNQIVTVNDMLYSSGDCLNLWKGHIESYDSNLKLWKTVDGSHLRSMSQAIIPANNFNNMNVNYSNCSPSPSPGRGERYERLYLTMAVIRNKLYFLGGYRLPLESRCLSTIHVFDTSPTSEEQRWQSLEPLDESGCKELCSHCCVVTI